MGVTLTGAVPVVNTRTLSPKNQALGGGTPHPAMPHLRNYLYSDLDLF